MLTEERRKQLDDIVSKMVRANERDDTIQFVVDDFKKKYEHEITQEQPEQGGFFSGVKDMIGERAEKLGDIVDKPQAFGSKVLQTAGQAAGGLFDIGMEGVKAITPEPIKKGLGAVGTAILDKAIKPVADKISDAKQFQNFTNAYDKWKSEHSEALSNLEAVVNLGAVLPVGGGAGAATKGVGEVVGKTALKIEESAIKSAEKIKDAYVKSLISPMKTKAVKTAEVARTTETGKGILKKSIIAPTTVEQKAIDSVKKIADITEKNTFQQNYNIIKNKIGEIATGLEKSLKDNNFIISKKEILAKLNQAKTKLSESPLITGDAEKIAEKLIAGAKKIIDSKPGTAEGVLSARKEFDIWLKSQKPKIFDSKSEGALSLATREVRNTLNDILEAKAPNIGVKSSLSEQRSLYTALDNIAPKAALEADTAIKRTIQSIMDIVGIKNKTVQAAATAAGVGGLGAAAIFAPYAIGAIGGTLVTYKAGKFLLRPEFRQTIANLLKEIEKASKTLTDPIQIRQLNKANEELNKYLKGTQPGLSLKDISKDKLYNKKQGGTYQTPEDYAKIQAESVARQKILDEGIKKGKGAIPKLESDIAKAKAEGKSFEEWSKNIKQSEYRKILNNTGYKDARLQQSSGFGNRKRDYGDYLFSQDREIFNQMYSDFLKTDDALKTKSQLKQLWDKVK